MNLEEFKIQVLPLKDKLYRLSLRLLGKVEEAEDTVQDAMLKLWMKKEELSGYQSVEALAVVMTRNICLDRIRSKDFRVQRLPDRQEVAGAVDPGEVLENKDLGGFIRKVVESLPEQQKTILHLRDIEGYEYEQIAEVMDMNVNAIRVNLSRARKKVRETILKIQDYELARN
jgi:RNA polymerase sigma-70 factor (ECF subfamily)